MLECLAPDGMRLVEIASCDVLLEVVAVVSLPEMQIESTSILDDSGFVFFPFGEVRDGDGDSFGNRRSAVAEGSRFNLGEHRAMVKCLPDLMKLLDAAAGMGANSIGEDGVDPRRTFPLHANGDTGAEKVRGSSS